MLTDRMQRIITDLARVEYGLTVGELSPVQAADAIEMIRRRQQNVAAELRRRESAMRAQRMLDVTTPVTDHAPPASRYASAVVEFGAWLDAFMVQVPAHGVLLPTVLERGAAQLGVNTHTARRYLMSAMHGAETPKYRIWSTAGRRYLTRLPESQETLDAAAAPPEEEAQETLDAAAPAPAAQEGKGHGPQQ